MEDTSQATDIAERESAIKSQEDKLKARYGNIDRRKGSMLMKKLKGSGRKYFDSGDYNMEVVKMSKKDPRHNPLARVNSVEGQPAVTKSADLPQKVKQPLKRQNSKLVEHST
ncbi:Oidioi.mRNA.OKI2018_I69.XSR.g15444.t1.cds [Oikopleura dioica]|uniref:Oidioi.mRNA.OKI2018_I69.XSR.g15444.t1.cds n=1 Tax=Oikopleura dioica TaxID=34765 RepID=A0ABN7SCW5_OIKDI|nr:Oidioi.mRNA.OKI2018_I69.XSR.g15444.t1.cds [Oikopleura dioica]